MAASAVFATSLLATLGSASPLKRAVSSSSSTITSSALNPSNTASSSNSIGLSVSDAYPPSNTLPDTSLFPPESVVGYQQPTPTGVEPFAIETAPYPSHTNIYPLTVPTTKNDSINIAEYWGNLSPAYSVSSAKYGLDSATPKIPENCSITQVHIYFRHGARYPTTGSAPSAFAEKLHNASLSSEYKASGDLSFLNTWTYKLGAELLTPFGRSQDFELGVGARMAYGGLLNNFTEAGTLPVWRTQSQDRMVKTMLNFAGGFFGIPEYQDQVNIEIGVEAEGVVNSGAPYDTCKNADLDYGYVGSKAAAQFVEPYFNKTATRLASSVKGLNFTSTDVTAMLQLCAYETVALGYSEFCSLFTDEEFRVFEHYYDIEFYGNNGPGSPVAAAQGLGYLQELVSRLNHTLITDFSNPAANQTLDGNTVTFPLNQSIAADAGHEVSIADALTALNLTALAKSGAPSNSSLDSNHTYIASQIVPFATSLQIQVVECSELSPTKQIRFILNDAVIPLTYEGCSENKDGLCAYDTVLSALIKRIDEIDYDYDCNGNYTVPYYGQVTNGRAPK
ncbi:histidine phosphatase family protein [Sporobolomyces salmoneus]|uniref:histidine phosphatase family protein n=1 Tax=Sporobolomyces salmoneus TaxID=183962 RepID=UPI00316FDD44